MTRPQSLKEQVEEEIGTYIYAYKTLKNADPHEAFVNAILSIVESEVKRRGLTATLNENKFLTPADVYNASEQEKLASQMRNINRRNEQGL